MVTITHTFQSAKADDPAAAADGQVLPSHWNAEHTVTGLSKSDVGLENVDNTSDADKPISTATQAALDGKVSSNVTGITGADQITNIVSLTQAEYDAIATKNASTFYVIAG